MIRRIAAAAVLTLALIGCGGLSAGQIIGTKYVPAHSDTEYYWYDCVYDSADDGDDCSYRYHWWGRPVFVADRWSIQIEGNCKPKDTSQTILECETRWIDVAEATYNAAKSGEQTWYGPTPSPIESQRHSI